MAHTKDANSTTYSASSSITISHTCAANSTVLIVCAMCSRNVASQPSFQSTVATYNGVSMTQKANWSHGPGTPNASTIYQTIWYMIDPPTGAAHDVVVSNTDGHSVQVQVASFISSTGKSSIPYGQNGSYNSGDATAFDNTTTTIRQGALVLQFGISRRATAGSPSPNYNDLGCYTRDTYFSAGGQWVGNQPIGDVRTLYSSVTNMNDYDISYAMALDEMLEDILVTENIGTLSDTAARSASFQRPVNETLGALSDTVSNHFTVRTQAVVEDLGSLTDTVVKGLEITRAAAEDLGTLADAVDWNYQYDRSVPESLGSLNDALDFDFEYGRVLREDLGALTDTVVHHFTVRTQKVAEDLGALTDATGRAFSVTRSAAEDLGTLSDALVVYGRDPRVIVQGSGYSPDWIYQVDSTMQVSIPAVQGSGVGVRAGEATARLVIRATGWSAGDGTNAIRVRGAGTGCFGEIVVGAANVPVPLGVGIGLHGNLATGSGSIVIRRAANEANALGCVGAGAAQVVVRVDAALSGTAYGSYAGSGAGTIKVSGYSVGVVVATSGADVWVVWAMNLDHGAVTEHTTSYNSWAEVDGTLYGADATGIYEVTGRTDNGTSIVATVGRQGMDLGTGMRKGFEDAFLRLSSEGNFDLTVESEETSGTVVLTDNIAKVHGAKADLPKGVRGRELSFTLQNKAGANFTIHEIELIYAISEQRRGRQTGG